MLTLFHNKTLDALEYTLGVIEQYDRGYEKLVVVRKDKSAQKEECKDDAKQVSRFDDVKTKYCQYVELNKDRLAYILTLIQNFFTCENACNLSKKSKEQLMLLAQSKTYIKIDEFLHVNSFVTKSMSLSNQVCSSVKTEIIVPIANSVVLVYDVSLKKLSVVFETVQNHRLVQTVAKKLQATRITLASSWMKLDFDNDGSVSLQDLLTTVRKIQRVLLQSSAVNKVKNLQQRLYKAISFSQAPVEAKNDVKEKSILKSDDDDNTSESIELKNLVEKDE